MIHELCLQTTQSPLQLLVLRHYKRILEDCFFNDKNLLRRNKEKMDPLELEGRNLGEKHKHYNQLLREALNDKKEPQPIDYSEKRDVQNLINIDLACRTRNVDYILQVLKCEDDLYYSKAIKRSTWMITDPKYAHIINPEYLFTEMYPEMTFKAFNKLLLSVRLNLKDESRAEAFYTYIKEKDVKLAYKWLQNCSTPFVENVVKNAKEDLSLLLDKTILKRLFKKSFCIFEAHVRKCGHATYLYSISETDALLKIYPEQLLDFLEVAPTDCYYYKIGPKGTAFLMKKYPDRILKGLDIFGKFLHVGSFAEMLGKSADVEEFLIQNADKELKWIYDGDKIVHFIKHMSEEKKFEFVRRIFIDKDYEKDSPYERIARQLDVQKRTRLNITETYTWYKYAPFDIAYKELIALVRAESLPGTRHSMLAVLVKCCRNIDHFRTMLQYYFNNHMNEPFKFKKQFIDKFISSADTHYFDEQMWDILCKIFHSMEVFIETENDVQCCVRAVLVRHIVRKEPVPEIIERKFHFDTLKSLQFKLKTQEDKDAVFDYLQNFIVKQSIHLNLKDKPDFDFAVHLCERHFEIIKDWGRDIHDYPAALARMKELTKVKHKKRWDTNLRGFYTCKKSWRKTLFEESIIIMQDEAVCYNALKHDPQFLLKSKKYLLSLGKTEGTSTKRLLRKMRIYWPQTLAEQWQTKYMQRLMNKNGHKALMDELCALYSQEAVSKYLKKYVPSEFKVVWDDQAHNALSLQKNIAMNIHRARPLPCLEDILPYAKGDFLQYTVPSINSLLSQLSPKKCRHFIPTLLNSPSSLRKIGLRCAVDKLSAAELIPMMCEIWNNTKSTSLRTVLFTHTHRMLRKVKGVKSFSQIKDIWELLSMFMDTLTPKDNQRVFKQLGEFYSMPESIQPEYYKKSFIVISSLSPKFIDDRILNNVEYSARDYLEHFDDEFFIKIFLKNFENSFTKDGNDYKELLIPAFILISNDEIIQVERYEKTLDVLLERYLPQWDNMRTQEMIKEVLRKLVTEMETYTFVKKTPIPIKVHERLLSRLEMILSYRKHYEYLTFWKLVIAFDKLLKENKDIIDTYEKLDKEEEDKREFRKLFETLHEKITPHFARTCVEILKEDSAQFGNSIWMLLAKAISSFYRCLGTPICESRHSLQHIKYMLQSNINDEQLHLMVRKLTWHEVRSNMDYGDFKNEMELYKEIYDLVANNSSEEVKMHYYQMFLRVGLPPIL